jgi:hypothetical protein
MTDPEIQSLTVAKLRESNRQVIPREILALMT